MKDITILTSGCNSMVGPGKMACYRNNGERNIRIVGIDMLADPTIKLYIDAFYQVPVATDPNYCDIVLDICRKEKVDIYFPNISAEVSAIVARKKDFEDIGVLLSISNQNSVEIANNKLRTYELLKKAGIPVPMFYPVHSVKDFEEGCSIMGYPDRPVCLKIVNGSGSRGVRIIDAKRSRYQIFAHEKPNSFYTSYFEMLSILKEAEELDEMMLVEFMPGNEFTVDLLADNGKTLYIVGRENTVSLMSIAQESILAYDENAYNVARDIIKLFKMDGNVGFDFMRDDSGYPVLMDINPRQTATLSICAVGGLNLPYLRIKQLLGEELPECKINYGVRLKRRYLESFVLPDGQLINL